MILRFISWLFPLLQFHGVSRDDGQLLLSEGEGKGRSDTGAVAQTQRWGSWETRSTWPLWTTNSGVIWAENWGEESHKHVWMLWNDLICCWSSWFSSQGVSLGPIHGGGGAKGGRGRLLPPHRLWLPDAAAAASVSAVVEADVGGFGWRTGRRRTIQNTWRAEQVNTEGPRCVQGPVTLLG